MEEQAKQLAEDKKLIQEKDSIIEDREAMIKNLCERFGVSEEDLM